jgi:hypothetical protein
MEAVRSARTTRRHIPRQFSFYLLWRVITTLKQFSQFSFPVPDAWPFLNPEGNKPDKIL